MVLTGINTGNVTVEVAPTDEPKNENWEEEVSTCLWAPADNLRVESLIHGAHYGLPLLSTDGPGWYQVEVKARGRHLERDGSNLESTESYLISVRPSPDPRTASDTTTHHLQETAAGADALRQRLIRGGSSEHRQALSNRSQRQDPVLSGASRRTRLRGTQDPL
ncbi:hypothetical protein [Streptomyces xanthophaeus]